MTGDLGAAPCRNMTVLNASPSLHPHATTPSTSTLRALSLLLPQSIFISNSSSLAGYFELYSLRQPPPITRVINCSHLLFPFPFLFFNPNKKRNQRHHRCAAINGRIDVSLLSLKVNLMLTFSPSV